MLYLASQFAWFLVAAFALGFVMGWISQDGGKLELWSHKLAYAAAVWALGAAVTWLQALNGVPALWVETALLFVAVYFVGCALAAAARAALEPKNLALGVMGLDGMPTLNAAAAVLAGAGPGAAEKAASYADTARAAISTAQEAGDRVKEVKSVVDEGKTIVMDIKSAAKTVKGLLKVENEDELPGRRPAGLVAARAAKPDDLKLIKGIGRQNEGRLHGLGIWHFDQIGAWSAENIEWVGSYLAFPGRIEREDWVGQAAALGKGEETAFARRVKSGEVASSRDDGSEGQDNVATLSDDAFEGERPKNLLSAARDGKPDDLDLIRGVGPAVAAGLNRLGIWHFDQIAALREPELRYASAFAGATARGVSKNWSEDADILANGGETAHSRTVKAGRKTP